MLKLHVQSDWRAVQRLFGACKCLPQKSSNFPGLDSDTILRIFVHKEKHGNAFWPVHVLSFFLKSRNKYHGNKKQETNPCEIGRTSWDGFVHHLQTPSTPCMRLTHNATQPHRKASVLDTYCSLNCVSALIEGLTCCESLNVWDSDSTKVTGIYSAF